MTLDDIRLLYSYDRWANARVFEAAAKLSDEQFTRDLGGSFRSIRDTLLHVIGGEWIWLQYWSAMPVSEQRISELRAERSAFLNPELFSNIATVRAQWSAIEEQQTKFVNSLSEEALHSPVDFHGVRLQLIDLVQHLANHSTYHRGQIALMMRQVGAEPVATDYHVFRVELERGYPATAR